MLDEADRILDMGFRKTIEAILSHFPKPSSNGMEDGRQTLLFSATSANDKEGIDALATLSLHNPARISISDAEAGIAPEKTNSAIETPDESNEIATGSKLKNPTPIALKQHYTLVSLHSKLSFVYSFIRTHLNSKILLFVSTTKQARYVYTAFAHLRPGTPLLVLTSSHSLKNRLSTYEKFSKNSVGVLISTDLASRGLDFPAVEWVVQMDLPDSVESYVHRVGRTARMGKGGQSLLVVSPGPEEMFVERLRDGAVVIAEIRAREKKVIDLQQGLQAMAFKDVEVKYLAQRVSYVFELRNYNFTLMFMIRHSYPTSSLFM